MGTALDLNPHLHVLVADGVFACREDGSSPEFVATRAPARDDLRGVIARVIARLETIAARRTQREQGFRTNAAYFAVLTDDLPAARDHLRVALSLEGGAVRRARLLLWQSRVLAALGEAREADATRAELLAMEGAEASVARAEAAQDARCPVSRARLRRMVPEVFLIDAAMVG